jgi:phosphoserine phosphatase
MASSESGELDSTGRTDPEPLVDNASAARALDDLQPVGAPEEGRPPPPIDLTAAAFFDVDNTLVQGSSADKIWPGTRELTQMHLDAGQQVWLITATPYELAETIARRLGLTGALGTVAESVDGVFTGRLAGEILHGTGKAHAVRSLAIREGLNLKRCTAYSDSYNDVPLLSLVGTAVAINPDARLRALARERGWEIRDFRTARKAARIGVPSALALGAAGGALAALASRRQSR